LKFWGGSILASDNMDSTESSKTDSSCVHLSLGFEDPLKMERTYEKLKTGRTGNNATQRKVLG